MQLTISTKDPDMLEHQCLALNCFVDEKPRAVFAVLLIGVSTG